MRGAADLDRLRVVLVATRNPLNIGAAARAMSNFGYSRLRVVNAYKVAFREARSAVGASNILTRAEECRDIAEAVSDCTLVVGTTAARYRQLQHPLRRLDQAARLIRRRLASGNVALLFGSEKRGLSNEDFSHCHWLLNIPTRNDQASMNLGQAVAVCLYEIVRGTASAAKVAEPKLASAGDVERFTQLLLENARASGYVAGVSAEAKIRRMVRRLNLNAADVEVWLGILRQTGWRLRTAPP